MIELFCTALIWGFSFALAKKSLNIFSPFELVTLRLFLGSITAFYLAKFFKGKAARIWTREHLTIALYLGIFEFAGTYILYTWSLKFMPSGVVGTLTLLTPIFTFLVSLVFGLSKVTIKAIAALVLSISGALLCLPLEMIFSRLEMGSPVLMGVSLILLSNLCFAIGNVAISKNTKRGQFTPFHTAQGLAIGALISLLFVLVLPHPSYERFLNPQVWAFPVYLGVVATGLGFYLWNKGVQKVSATPASLIGNFKAPFSLIWGALLLSEPLSFRLIIGMLLLLSATVVLPREP